MALRAKKPADVAKDKRLKLLMFGPAGVGKTTAATQFPKPYLIDTERGAENEQYIRALEAVGGVIFQSNDFDDVVSEIVSLLSEPHDYQTLIIDPISTIYDNLVEQAEKKVGSEFGRHYGVANKEMKHLISLLLRPDFDMNVIVTSHAKAKYGDDMKQIGVTFDAWKKSDYPFDLVLELAARGEKRVAIPRKTRIGAFVKDEAFEFSYDTIADMYGREQLERTVRPVDLATDDQVDRLTKLLTDANVDEKTVTKILAKYSAENFSELPADAAQRAIDHYAAIVDGMKKGAA